tara:strand:+ start:2783 stop:4072 length:1290 start_codon:yes stop_codon:yes gene_type:complete
MSRSRNRSMQDLMPVLKPLLSMLLRALTLVSRFFLLFILATVLSPSDFGFFGLFSALVVFLQYVAGGDFYVYSARTALSGSHVRAADVLMSHAAFLSATCMLVMVPYSVFVFFYAENNWASVGYFFLPIFLFELIGQECGRLLVALGRPFGAGVVSFCRSGIWPAAMGFWVLMYPNSIDLDVLMWGWLIGSLSGVVAAVFLVSDFFERGRAWFFLGRRWLVSGFGVCLPYWASSLALKVTGSLDRFWFESLAGGDVLAAFVLYAGIAGAVGSFLDAGVFSYLYPRMVRYWQQDKPREFMAVTKKMLLVSVLVSAFCMLAVLLFFPCASWFIKEDVYFEHIEILAFLLLSQVFFAVSMVAHFSLYSQRADKVLLLCHLAMLPVFAIAVYGVSFFFPLYAVPLGVCGAFLFLMAIKWYFYFGLTPLRFRIF